MANEYEDSSLKVQSWHSYVSERTDKNYDGDKYVQHNGHVATPYGYVTIYADSSKFPCTGLYFIWQGRVHHRAYRRYFRPSYIITLAKQFAAELAQPAPSAEAPQE